ncbi:nitroreductase [Geomonas sp. Red276]
MAVAHSLYREAGTVTVDHAICTNCGICAGICPVEVLRMEKGVLTVHPESNFGCIACGHCMMSCPSECIEVTGRGVSPADLFPLPPREERADGAAMAALIRSRRSVRHFTGEVPSREILEKVLSMAATGPMGIPPWDVGCVVVRGRERVQGLADEILKGYEGLLKVMRPGLLALLRLFMKKPAYEQMSGFIIPLAKAYIDGKAKGRDLLFYDAPAVIIFHHSPYVDPSETMIACTYAMLAAESLGLGSTMIGAAAPILVRNRKLCGELGIPEGNKPAIALILGYPAVAFRRGITRHFSAVSWLGD